MHHPRPPLRCEGLEDRSTPSVALDPTFGTDGMVVIPPVERLRHEHTYAAAQLPDGRVILAGHRSASGRLQASVIRLTADGQFDTTFGNGGRATVAFDPAAKASGIAFSMLAQPDGRVVIAGGGGVPDVSGTTTPGSAYNFAAARLTPDGQFDPTFGNGGIIRIPFDRGEATTTRPTPSSPSRTVGSCLPGWPTGQAGDRTSRWSD